MKLSTSRFIKSIVSLIFSQAIIKVFGLVYTLYITNKTGFGDKGNAIYMSGYQIYLLILTISMIGIPNSMSKLIAEKEALRDFRNQKRILYAACLIFGSIGFIGTVILNVFSGFISEEILEIEEAKDSIKALSPAVFFVTIGAVLRGYFNGKNNFKVGAITQIVEQLGKMFLTIVLVEITAFITEYNTCQMAVTASIATTVATIISFIYIVRMYYKEEKIKVKKFNNLPSEKIGVILKKIFLYSSPILISSLLSSLSKNVDSITIVRILKNVIGESEALIKYGILSSKVDVLIAIPLSITSSISAAIIPEISEKRAINDIKAVENKIIEAIDLTAMIATPCLMGMLFYSKEIFMLLFPKSNEGFELLAMASVSIIFLCLTQSINGILQALDKNFSILKASIASIIIKVILNVILINIEGIYEKGAVISSFIAAIVSFIIVRRILFKNFIIRMNIIQITYKYFLFSIIMIFFSKVGFMILKKFDINFYFLVILSIGISVVIYSFFIILLKIFEKNYKRA